MEVGLAHAAVAVARLAGVWVFLMAIVPFVSSTFGGLAGFGVLMAAVALAFWRLERFCARQYWHGLREYKLCTRPSEPFRHSSNGS